MRWFERNLALQVEDIELKRARKTVVYYFDTADVQGALLGMQDLYGLRNGKEEFQKEYFDGKRTLIRSLLSSKWLGQIRMLPPHQDEFISKLKKGFKTWNQADWKSKVGDFISKVDLSLDSYLSPETEAQDPKIIASLLKEDIEQAEKLFKVFQNLLPWHRRLGIWQRKELIHYEVTEVDPVLLTSPEFELLRRTLDNHPERRDVYINNFTDALAWAYLLFLIERFNTGKDSFVPRLYSPASRFSLQRVLELLAHEKETAEQGKALKAKLECKSATGNFSALRDDDYYLFKVAFRSDSFAAPPGSPISKNDEDLIDLYTQVKGLIPPDDFSARNDEDLPIESFRKLSYEGKPIVDFIEELQQLTFFKSEWLSGTLYTDLWKALNDVREQYLNEIEQMQGILQHENYQAAVKIAIDDIEGKIGQNVQAFSLIPTFWRILGKEIEDLELRVHRDGAGVNDYYRDLGLLRYGFPQCVRSKVNDILNGLSSGEEDRKQESYLEFINDYLSARFYKSSDVNCLLSATAVLVALRMYKEVFILLESRSLDHYSLQIVHAEMFFILARKNVHDRDFGFKAGREIIENLRKLQAGIPADDPQNADLCVGLAYLFQKAWEFKVRDAEWRKVSLPLAKPTDVYKRWQNLIDTAIYYASKAYSLLDEERLQQKVYSLNQYVFCLVEGGVNERLTEMKEAAQSLATYKSDSYLWQFRYDDTLARFYHRLAVYARTKEKWDERVEDALSLIEEARRKSDKDEDVESYYNILKIYKSRGFSQRKH